MGYECVTVRTAICVRACVSAGAGAMKSSMTQVLRCASLRSKCLVGDNGHKQSTRLLKADGTVLRGSGQQSTCTLQEANTWQLYKRLMICVYVCQRGSAQV